MKTAILSPRYYCGTTIWGDSSRRIKGTRLGGILDIDFHNPAKIILKGHFL